MKDFAERIARFDSVAPHAASISDIDEARQLLNELPASQIFDRFNLMLKIGSFYLESKAFEINYSMEAARSYYTEAQKIAYQENHMEWIIFGGSGIANCYANQYKHTGNSSDFERAETLYNALIEKCEISGLREVANSNRTNYSRLLANAKLGDRFSNMDKAINLLKMVLDNSSQEVLGENFKPGMYGRILFNIGVLFQQQLDEPQMRSIYVNKACEYFMQALEYRPAESDPIGRARALRALASVLPEWAGADSVAHARALANGAIEEAETLEATGGLQEKAGWAVAAESLSALQCSLDTIDKIASNRRDILAEIEKHRSNVQRIDKDQQPFLWADWQGGYALLLGRVGIEDGKLDFINESKNSFIDAIAVIPEMSDPRLRMILFRELGRVCHQVADWEGSLKANKKASEIGLSLADNAPTDISRTNELESFTRALHFAAFAASQLNLGEEAIELAEIGRARWMDDAIDISLIRVSSLPPEIKSKIDEIQADILEFERQEEKLANEGVSGLGRQLQNLFNIPLGDATKIRLTADPQGVEAKRIQDLSIIRGRLQDLKAEMNTMLNSMRSEGILSMHPTYNQIKGIAEKAGFPLVYLLTSTWGSVALIVNGTVEILNIPNLDRGQLQKLLYAKNGYMKNLTGHQSELEVSLENIQKILDEHLIPPLISWCNRNQKETIGIIGIGDIGMLPLQVATVPAGLSIHILPSARALQVSLTQEKKNDHAIKSLVTIGDTNSNGLPPLKFSRAETLFFNHSFREVGATVKDFTDQPTLSALEAGISNATHVLFSCHGKFAAFSPLRSVLYLEGDEQLPVENLLRPSLKLQGIELVILSACNSASSENWKTPDEAIGFPAAFLIAGAKTVIAALWPVSDTATFLLMQQFGRELLINRFDPGRSLVKAQAWLRGATKSKIQDVLLQIHDTLSNSEMRTRRVLMELKNDIESFNNDYPFRDRQYWAGFVCVGA